MPEMWIKKIIRGNVVAKRRMKNRKLGNEKMRKWISGENSSLSCRISETGRTRVLNKWNLWDEFEGFISGRSFDNGCGK